MNHLLDAVNAKIAELAESGAPLAANGRRAAVFIANAAHGLHVGWNYAPADAVAGDRFHYDHGTVGTNRDGLYVWLAPDTLDAIAPMDAADLQSVHPQ